MNVTTTERPKKAEVIAMMKRAEGVTLAEIMQAGAYDPRVREYPGQQGRREDRILQECIGRADVPHREVARHSSLLPTPSPAKPGAAFREVHFAAPSRKRRRGRSPRRRAGRCRGRGTIPRSARGVEIRVTCGRLQLWDGGGDNFGAMAALLIVGSGDRRSAKADWRRQLPWRRPRAR
jgi:hypothetical protein